MNKIDKMNVTFIWEYRMNNAGVKFYKSEISPFEQVKFIAVLELDSYDGISEELLEHYPAFFFFNEKVESFLPAKNPDLKYLCQKIKDVDKFETFIKAEKNMDKMIKLYMNNSGAQLHGMGSSFGFVNELFNNFIYYKWEVTNSVEKMLTIATNGEFTKIDYSQEKNK